MPLTKQEWIDLEALVEIALKVVQGESDSVDMRVASSDLGNALRLIRKAKADQGNG